MHGDQSNQSYRRKMRPPTSVASEASMHRQKIASLRSHFLNQPLRQLVDDPLINNSASSMSINHSLLSDEPLSRSFTPRSRNSHLPPSLTNGFPSFHSRLNFVVRPDSHSSSFLLDPPKPNTPVSPRASSCPRRIAKRNLRSVTNKNAFPQFHEPTKTLHLTNPNKSRISNAQPPWKYFSPHYTDSNCPTIVYETLTNVRAPETRLVSKDVNVAIPCSQSSFRNSMFYHRSVVEPTEQYQSVITLSPSEPLCLYAARQNDFCRSCQRLATSGTSSFHRSSSRHSMRKESSEDSLSMRCQRRNKLHNSLPTGYRSVNDLKRRSRRRILASSVSSSSSSSSLDIRGDNNPYGSFSSDEFWPITISKPHDRTCGRRRTRSLNPRMRSRAVVPKSSMEGVSADLDEDDNVEDDARAVDALAMRLQPMLAEGRTVEVQSILLKALTRPEMRQRALFLLDYLTSEGAIFDFQSPSQDQSSHKVGKFHNDPITDTSDLSSDLSQSFASRLKLAGAVANNDSGEEEDDDDKSSEIFGNTSTMSVTGDGRSASTATSPDVNAAASAIVRVMLPPGGLVEPPPPRLSMPLPKPLPPPSPRSAVVPAAKDLARIDDHVLKMLNVNPLLITDLVSQLKVDCNSDVELVRRLFRWVTAKNFDLVEYDPSAPRDSFIGMLRNVQMGSLSRNELFHELCRFAGIYCQYISGYSKGAGYRPGMSLKQGSLFRNTWLVVYAAGGWRFVNCNWAARYATSAWNTLSPDSTEMAPKCDDFYFFTDPEQHIFEHWPDNKVWQLLHAKPISQARFVALPVLKSAFFNAGLSLKKPYSQRLVTKNGQVSIKLRMPYFVGISCSLENYADGSFLKGFCLAEVLIKPSDMVRIHCAPSQPGRYYLNVYVSPDWRRDDIRELACSFQVHCCEFNYQRLVVMGRLPEVGFLGRTPAAQHFGVSLFRSSSSTNRPYILHTSSDPLKIPFLISPGLRLCHQLKSFDRPGHQMTDCDNYALLQMRPSSGFDVTTAITTTATNALGSSLGCSAANAHYHLRLPASAFYYLTVYAAYEDIGTISTEASDHLECVYRILVDARRPTISSGSGLVPAFPRQTYWWVGARLLEPTRLSLEVNKRHLFRLDVPIKYASVAVVINASEWHFLKSSPTSSSSGCARWSGKVVPAVIGELAIYASTVKEADNSTADNSECVPYVKLLEYSLFQPVPPPQPSSSTPPQQQNQQSSADMEFKINEEFAKHYNEYRQKEEYQKLKSRYGDVKLLDSKKEKEEEGSDDYSSSSSSSEESDSEWEEQEHEDFLRLYDALCRDDPALNDDNKVWFREKPENSEKQAKEKIQPVLLKDHARELLLSEEKMANGEPGQIAAMTEHVENAQVQKDNFLAETEKLFGKCNENEEIFTKKASDTQTNKHRSPSIDTSHFTFQVSGEDADFLRDYLVNRRWKVAEKSTGKAPKPSADAMAEEILSVRRQKVVGTDEPLLTVEEDLEADDEFLVKARRFEEAWNRNDKELAKEYPKTSASRYRFEEEDKEFIKSYPRKIESSLRQLSTKGLTRAEKRKARAERKAAEKAAKMADIERLKKLKMAEFAEKLERIRKTCGEGLAVDALLGVNTGGKGSLPMDKVTEEVIDSLDNDWDPEAHDRLVAKLFDDSYYGAETADDNLDEAPKVESDEDDNLFPLRLDNGDYDGYIPRQRLSDYHDENSVTDNSSRGEKYENGARGEVKTSALDRAAKELENNMSSKKRGKREHSRSLLRSALDKKKPVFDPTLYPDFEKYFNEFYQLDCEDIINGSGPGDDVHCRFKYREVKPNDFGLSVEEILDADEKELNRWVSVRAMSKYRTEEEEERDLRKYHSYRMLKKKTSIIPSLVNKQTDQDEAKQTSSAKAESAKDEKSAEDEEKRLSKKALKRLRKKQRKAELFSALAAVEGEAKESGDKFTPNANSKSGDERAQKRRPTKKRKHKSSETMASETQHKRPASKRPKLSDERLRAAGIDPKQYKFLICSGKM